jgi:hypothetical protein
VRRPVRSAVVTTAAVGVLLLTACGSGNVPDDVVNARWQVTDIEDAARADSGNPVTTGLSDADQARTWLSFSTGQLSGGVGCLVLDGDVEWKSGDTLRITDLHDRDADGDNAPTCMPGDRTIADRLTAVLADTDLHWESGDSGDYRKLTLSRDDDGTEDWQTARSVSLLGTH